MTEPGPTLTVALRPDVASREAAASPTVRIDPARAQLCAWLIVALVNQVIAVLRLPSAEPQIRLLCHLHDLGQLLALGALSWLVVRVASAAARSWRLDARWLSSFAVAILVFAVGLVIVPDDVLNLAERRMSPVWQMTMLASSVLAVALSIPVVLRPWVHGSRRVLAALAGLCAISLNAEILRGDYFGFHFMLAWFGALWLAAALEGLQLSSSLWPESKAWVPAVALGSAASVLIPTSDTVRLRLYQLPSSIVQPLITVLMPERPAPAREKVPVQYLQSPWFSDRSKRPTIPPTRALAPTASPIVIFFTIDSVRADVLETDRYRLQLPELARLRDTGVSFTRARAPTTSTMTTLASVLTGRYYSQLPWSRSKLGAVASSEAGSRLPELLSAAGVETLFAAGLPRRIEEDCVAGQGFSRLAKLPRTQQGAALVVDAVVAELERRATGPLFVFGHFLEPHAPYNLAGKHGTQFERYVREIALVDRELARLRSYLERKGFAQRTYLFISADHGEAFGEHGSVNHARTMYEELLRVPLLVHAPGAVSRHVPDQVSLMDIGPTVLDLFGLPTPGYWMGESLVPLIAGQPARLERPLAFDGGRRIQGICFPDGHKVILDASKKTVEVYHLQRDSGELTNLVDIDRAKTEPLVETTRAFFDAVTFRAPGYSIPKRKF